MVGGWVGGELVSRVGGALAWATWALGSMASGIDPSKSGVVCKRPCREQKPKGSHAPESPQSQQPPSVWGAGGGAAAKGCRMRWVEEEVSSGGMVSAWRSGAEHTWREM